MEWDVSSNDIAKSISQRAYVMSQSPLNNVKRALRIDYRAVRNEQKKLFSHKILSYIVMSPVILKQKKAQNLLVAF